MTVSLAALVGAGCAGRAATGDLRARAGDPTDGAPTPHMNDGRADDPWAPRSEAPGYPVWPTAIAHATGPLLDPEETRESRLLEAMNDLQGLPVAAIQAALVRSVGARSVKVRRLAISQCLERDVNACVPVATERLAEDREEDPGLELMLLTLVAQQPGPDQVDALIDAAYAQDDALRQHAVMLLGQAPPLTDRTEAVTSTLVAKLGDGVAGVRAEAARSLGLVDAEQTALALVRLLDDPDPTVRGAAAESLGRLGDPRTANALGRALPRAGAAEIAAAMIEAVALIPGETADELALAAFDDPPRHLSRKAVVTAIALRPDPSDVFVDGLVRRLRDPEVRDDALAVLLGLGAAAAPRLRAASERGLEPALALEVRRLLASLEASPSDEATRSMPSPQQVFEGLLDDLRHGRGDPRDQAAIALGRMVGGLSGAPDEFEPELTHRAAALAARALELAPSAEAARPWLLALLAGVDLGRHHDTHLVWARLERWSRDDGAPVAERCFATIALASAPQRGRWDRDVDATLTHLLGTGPTQLRGCAAMASLRRASLGGVGRGPAADRRARRELDALAEATLQDDSADVRSFAALALTGTGPHTPRTEAHLRRLAARDPDPHVQASARLALARAVDPERPFAPLVPVIRADRRARPGWSRVDLRGAAGRDGAPATVWFPAPGGGSVVLGLDAPDWRPDGVDLTPYPVLEGILDEDTIDIHNDVF